MVLVTQKTNKYLLELSLFPRHSKPFFVKEMVGEFRNPTKFSRVFDALSFRIDNCDAKNNEIKGG